MPTPSDPKGQPEDLEGTIQALLERREQVFEKAEMNIKDAQRKQKETYDRKHTPEELPVGTEVMVENTAQKDRKGGKLDDMFKGNYFIHERLGKGLYKLRNKKGVVLQKKFNISRLKVYKRHDTGNIASHWRRKVRNSQRKVRRKRRVFSTGRERTLGSREREKQRSVV